MSLRRIHKISPTDRNAALSHFTRMKRRHNLAPQEIRSALDTYREVRMRVLDFSHTNIGRRILPSLHAWEEGTANPAQFQKAEIALDRLLTIVAWGQHIAPKKLRDLMHEEVEDAFPSRASQDNSFR